MSALRTNGAPGAVGGTTVDPCVAFPHLAPLITYLNGLTARADLEILERLLTDLDCSRDDVGPACAFGTRGYRRNTVARSDWFELLAICWRSGHCTPIHDHRGVSCAFKVIEGVGTEVRFNTTDSGQVVPAGTVEMRPGYICAARDEDIHQVANFQAPGNDLITLHIYSPPIKSMKTYHFAEPADSPKVYTLADDLDDWCV